jgi:methyl-accepting chemotaxis protein
MPKIKRFIYTLITLVILLAGGTAVYAQSNPEALTQIQTKYNEFLRYHQNIKIQTGETSKYILSLSALNNKEVKTLTESYNRIFIDENINLNELPKIEVIKTLRLALVRYENLNLSIYKILGQINDLTSKINESGFATENVSTEIETLSDNIVKIETNLATLNYVVDQVEQSTMSLEEGIQSSSDLIKNVNTEYKNIFSKFLELTANAK